MKKLPDPITVAGAVIYEAVSHTAGPDGFAWRWTGRNAREALTESLRSMRPRPLARAFPRTDETKKGHGR